MGYYIICNRAWAQGNGGVKDRNPPPPPPNVWASQIFWATSEINGLTDEWLTVPLEKSCPYAYVTRQSSTT